MKEAVLSPPSNTRQQKDNFGAGRQFFSPGHEDSFFKATGVQAKLNIGRRGDKYEEQADLMADKVVSKSADNTSVSQSKTVDINTDEKLSKKEEEQKQEEGTLQLKPMFESEGQPEVQRNLNPENEEGVRVSRRENEASAVSMSKDEDEKRNGDVQKKENTASSNEASPTIEYKINASKGRGSPLDNTTRSEMESGFGNDFSGVRIHTGTEGQLMSKDLNAQAFTHGKDIYFDEGKYNPQSSSGKNLLAHELTHTIQQGASPIQPKSYNSQNAVVRKEIKPDINSAPVKKLNTGQVLLQRRIIDESLLSSIDFSDKSGGRQLPREAKDYLEDYYKTNLSDIRIFTDNEVASLCRAAGIKAFAKDKYIGIIPSWFDPESEDGAVLLSDQVSKSLKQRGIRSAAADGNESGGTNTLINQILAAVKENKAKEENPAKDTKGPSPEIGSKDKKHDQTGKEEIKKTDKKGDGKKLKKAKLKAKDKESIGIKPVKPNPKKSPSTPDEDPAFQKVVKKTREIAKGQKQHEDAEKKSAEAQNSAKAVPNEAESKAQNRKTDGLGEAAKEDKPFDAVAFKADLLKKIEDVTPKNLEEATEFKENNKIDGVKTAMGEKVTSEKQNTNAPVNNAVQKPLQVKDADNKKPVPLPPTPNGPLPGNAGAKNAAPKNKLESEISMEQQSQSLDEEMKANNVTEEQLASSNEPTFTEALDEKKNAQQDAVEKPKEFRKDETLTLKEAKADVNEKSVQTLVGMHGARGKNFEASVAQQQTAKQKDEERRANVAKTIDEKFALAEQKVNAALEDAEKMSSQIFDEGAESARVQFENYVDVKMREYKRRRYSGFWGGLRWVKDKLFGMPDEVNRFYSDGRELYLKKMDEVITQVANVVTTKLNEAKKAITDGKKEIDEYVNQLPKDLKDVGKEAAESIQDKFDALEQSVNDKRDGLIDGLAKKYVDNVKKLDDRIGELKEANQGLVDKAIGFLKKVWQVIKDLTNLFTTILARLASIIGVILGNPSGFFENVGKAFKTGFDNFKNKFTEYLEIGLMEWLATNLGIKGIELPQKFDASAIFSLALQVMGITKVHIKERAIALLGERKVSLLEKAGGLIYRVYNEGLGVIWDMIVEKLSDFKELVWDAIKSFIQKSIIEAALVFILSLLNPIGAFIKVCMAIYDFLMMLVRFKDRIIELLDTILSAVTNIASGAVESAATMIEKALAKSISVIIGFLAALLHLNNIFAKIREIITRIQKRVEKALDWVIKKAYSLVGKLVEGALKLEDKATAAVEKGKQAVVGAGKKVAGKVLGWLGLKKEFTAADGKQHEIYFKGTEASPKVMVASKTPKKIEDLVAFRKSSTTAPALTATQNNALTQALTKKQEMDNFITTNKTNNASGGSSTDKLSSGIDIRLESIKKDLINGDAIPSTAALPLSNITYSMDGTKAKSVIAKPLTKLPGNTSGSAPVQVDSIPPGWQHIRAIEGAKITMWVKAHMVNENLHGPGVGWNLVPATQQFNSQMRVGCEKWAKDEIAKDEIIYYKAEVTGWHNKPTNPLISNFFPSALTVTYGYMVNPAKNRTQETSQVATYSQDAPPETVGASGPPNINTMSRDNMRGIFAGVTNVDKIYSTRNSLPNSSFRDLGHMYLRLREAYNKSPQFESSDWPLISQKFNFENAFRF